MAGQITSVEAFADQNSKPSWKMIGINGVVISFIVSALTPICVVLALGHIKPWWILFGIAAICTLGATLTFLSGSASYKYPKSQESAITTLLRVFVASFSKISKTHPGCDSLYISYSFYRIPYTNRLRCLDKAAIILPASPSIEQQQKRRWRLCTVTEVEETKKIICMIPIWMNFILIGVVSSIGNTYFVEQANNLNKRYGLKIEGHSRGPFPLLVLLVLQEYARAALSHLPWEQPCRLSRPFKYLDPSNTRRHAPLLALSMTMASLCCIVAASVERLRLSVVKSHGLLEEPNEGIPMNTAWLIPQFILLGVLNGSKETAFRFLLLGEVPQPRNRYRALAHGVFGVGTITSVLSVYLVGKMKLTWFQETLNRSRLDNYYWTLAALTAANLPFYVSLSFPCWSSHREPDSVHRPNDIHTDCEVEAEMDIAP
ncbi:protein NRT1/ PTR FAMILY 5.5-like [Rosa sericea]